MSMSVRFGDDVRRLLRVFSRSSLRFYGVTVGRYGFGVIAYDMPPFDRDVDTALAHVGAKRP